MTVKSTLVVRRTVSASSKAIVSTRRWTHSGMLIKDVAKASAVAAAAYATAPSSFT